MINFIEPLALMGVLTLASADPSSVCKMPEPTRINVVPRTEPVKYDISQTLAQIQSQDIDTINPYGFGSKSSTTGYMKGEVAMLQEVKIKHQTVRGKRYACVWYDTITLKIEIDPTIVIAKEVAEDPCRYKAVKEHELKHVMVDRKIVNKYAKSMGQKVFDGLQSRGFIVGPIKAEDAPIVAKRMQSTVAQLLELETKKMEIERAEGQQAIDSLEEYGRVNDACKSKARSSHRRR